MPLASETDRSRRSQLSSADRGIGRSSRWTSHLPFQLVALSDRLGFEQLDHILDDKRQAYDDARIKFSGPVEIFPQLDPCRVPVLAGWSATACGVGHRET